MWNMRSLASYIVSERLPVPAVWFLAAMISSVVSSPTFSRILSMPFLWNMRLLT